MLRSAMAFGQMARDKLHTRISNMVLSISRHEGELGGEGCGCCGARVRRENTALLPSTFSFIPLKISPIIGSTFPLFVQGSNILELI